MDRWMYGWLTCGLSRGRRMWARRAGSCDWREEASWWTQLRRAVTTVSSSGTFMSSEAKSFSTSHEGKSRNSWCLMTSMKCSYGERERDYLDWLMESRMWLSKHRPSEYVSVWLMVFQHSNIQNTVSVHSSKSMWQTASAKKRNEHTDVNGGSVACDV